MSTPRQPCCTVSRQQNWTDCGTSLPDDMFAKSIATVLELIGRNPGILLAVRLDVWNRYGRCTSLMWKFWRRDVTRGRPERMRSLVLPDCLFRLHNNSIVLRWQPKCIASTFCPSPAWSIPIARRRWFSSRRGITLALMSCKQNCFSYV
jgi:hypothetical protein